MLLVADELPRQKLETRFKPWPVQAQKSRDGVIETQHRVPPVQASRGGRYDQMATAAKNAILPPKDGVSVASNPFGRALQQGAEQAKNLAAEVKQQILPPADQIFGSGGLNTKGIQNAIGNTADRLRGDLQRGVQGRVQQAADQAEQGFRNAVDNAGQSARNAVDQFGRSRTTPQKSILPGGQQDHSGHDHAGHDHAGHDHGSTRSPGQILPGQTPAAGLAGKGRRIDTPIQPRQPQPRQSQQRKTQPRQPRLGAPPASMAQPTPARAQPDPWRENPRKPPAQIRAGDLPASRYGQRNEPPAQTAPAWSREPSSRDDFDIANGTPSNRSPIFPKNNDTGNGYAERRQQGFNTASTDYGDKADNGFDDGPALGSPRNDYRDWSGDPTSSQTQSPTIYNDRPDPQSDRSFQSANSNPSYQLPATIHENQPRETEQNGWNWGQDRYDSNLSDEGTGSNNKTVFPLVLSWVLLTSSGVGNAYLLLSYYDVRNKYRGMVHGSPRRRDRYDD